MLGQNDIKTLRSLKEKKFRDALSLFVVEGEKLVQEALSSDFEVKAVYRKTDIGEVAMNRISSLSTTPDVLAVVKIPSVCRQASLRRDGIYLILDSLRDPGNMGTIIRLADWYGIDGIFASEDSVDIFNPKVVQSTMGAIFRVPFTYCDPLDLKSQGGCFFGTFLQGENIYVTSLEFEGPRFIVVGNESNGISSRTASICDRKLTIPSFAKGKGSESLNAAVATAIIVSEFKRR